MPGFLRALPTRHRAAWLALAVSAVVHAAILIGMPRRIAAIEPSEVVYAATLEPGAPGAEVAAAAVSVPAAIPRRRAAPAHATVAPEALLGAAPEVIAAAPPPEPDLSRPLETPVPEEPTRLALAEPNSGPLNSVEPDPFPQEALPASVSISYRLTSSFADGRAVYHWDREGNNYRITGEAEAEGFFALFLEGRIRQESRGTVGSAGLRPDRYLEQRPPNVREGLEFDWPARQVTMVRGDSSKAAPLADNTVDWLSMIFQLAHMPPRGETMSLQVYTQRRLYRYRLAILGVEEIDIPIGRVRALHLRHVDEKDKTEVVDVWLGLDQHNLPVKLRFPVARNRLVVEQVATQVSAR